MIKHVSYAEERRAEAQSQPVFVFMVDTERASRDRQCKPDFALVPKAVILHPDFIGLEVHPH